MKLTVSTNLPCPPEWAWSELRKPSTLIHVGSPLLRFELVEPDEFPETWEEATYRVKLKMFGVIPMGSHHVVITDTQTDETPGAQRYGIRDNGFGDLVKKWDHVITIRENSDGTTHYTDTVHIEAGILTIGVWLFASLFYRYRQIRWRRLVRRAFNANALSKE